MVWIIENGAGVEPGDVLVRLDTSTIETNINTQEIAYNGREGDRKRDRKRKEQGQLERKTVTLV